MTVGVRKAIVIWAFITTTAIAAPVGLARADGHGSQTPSAAANPFNQIYGKSGDKIQKLDALVRKLKSDGLTENQIAQMMEAAPDVAWRIQRSREAGFSDEEIFTRLGVSNVDLPRPR